MCPESKREGNGNISSSHTAGDLRSSKLLVQSENLRPMEMVGLGRPQTCSGAQGSLQHLAKGRLRDLVQSLWGGGSSTASHQQDSGHGLQQGDGACDPGWMGSLLSHRAVSMTVLVATAALVCLAFWDYRLVLKMVSALSCACSGMPLLHAGRSHGYIRKHISCGMIAQAKSGGLC